MPVETVPKNVALADWVAQAARNPSLFRVRRATQVLLHAIGMTPELNKPLILKGGTLMSLVFGSKRVTGDVDFTVEAEHREFEPIFIPILDAALERAAASLGYLDLVCRVQSCIKEPSRERFDSDKATGPGLKVKIGLARRNSGQEQRLYAGEAAEILGLDLSFKEPVISVLPIQLDGSLISITAYSMEEIIGEKFRAILQQSVRGRNRRQDIYDICWLILNFRFTDEQKATIHTILMHKGDARGVNVMADSLDEPDIKTRSAHDWNSLAQEVGKDALPDFETAYQVVKDFYKSLPW